MKDSCFFSWTLLERNIFLIAFVIQLCHWNPRDTFRGLNGQCWMVVVLPPSPSTHHSRGLQIKKKERTKGEKKLCLILIYVPVPLILVCSHIQVQHLPACENIFFVYVFVKVLSTIPTTASLRLQLWLIPCPTLTHNHHQYISAGNIFLLPRSCWRNNSA